jgi:heterodisulfide reductase subunit A-like polyferredoxin
MKKPKFITEFKDIPTERARMPELPVERRAGNFDEVELGLTEETALREAARCLSCRRCIGCGLCLAECEQEAVVYDETASELTLEADSIVFTSDGAPFSPDRKPELGYRASANVITSLEFERLASPTGPFGGYILRPFDGDRPRRIAFVQCVGSREEGIGANFCSTVCCSRTFSQARSAREQLGEVAVTVFHRGLRPIGKRSEIELAELEAAEWIDLVEAGIKEIKQDKTTGTVTVSYTSEGRERDDTFDLVVLAVGVHSSPEFRRYARTAGLKTNKYGFVDRGLPALAAGDGVTFAGVITGPAADSSSVVDAGAAATRSLSPDGVGEVGEPALGSGRPVVFACEYGLGLAGKGKEVLGILGPEGIEVGGSYPFLCYKEGRTAMAEKAGEAGRIVVLGCHRGGHESLFEGVLGLGRGAVSIVGIDDMKNLQPQEIKDLVDDPPGPDGFRPKVSTVAVVGGGTSGLAAAAELLRLGLEVVLIEKSPEMGMPFLEAFREADGEPEAGEAFMGRIRDNPAARIMVSSKVVSFKHTDRGLLLGVAGAAGEEAIEVGAVLVATGAGRHEAVGYPYGTNPTVIDQWELKARLDEGKARQRKVVMIQCVGARDGEHPYCSRYCCRQALSNALVYKSKVPEAEITVLHKGIRVFGFEEDLYTDAMEQGVRFVGFDGRPEISEGKALEVRVTSGAEGETVLPADLVVLSLAHQHGEDQKELSRLLGAPLDDLGFYASGNPFSDPFRTRTQGVFVCGFARRPVVPEEAFLEGVAAAGAIWKALMR